MSRIITTTELQKHIGQVSNEVQESFFIVTNRGKANMVVLPYFDHNDEQVEEYLEHFEMNRNKDALKKRYTESLKSGESDLSI